MMQRLWKNINAANDNITVEALMQSGTRQRKEDTGEIYSHVVLAS